MGKLMLTSLEHSFKDFMLCFFTPMPKLKFLLGTCYTENNQKKMPTILNLMLNKPLA